MTDANLERALRLLDELEQDREMPAPEVEYAVHDILSAAGYAVSSPLPGKPDNGIDMTPDRPYRRQDRARGRGK
ncbi:MAG: hypothetical protein IPL62_19185 [Caulobacteraceae bacterium]|nr:hypothetical protein [Caulobacteraceae bacterium]